MRRASSWLHRFSVKWVIVSLVVGATRQKEGPFDGLELSPSSAVDEEYDLQPPCPHLTLNNNRNGADTVYIRHTLEKTCSVRINLPSE